MSDDYSLKAAEDLLASLRWDVDTIVANPLGDPVWLGPLVIDGKRVGIRDCCFTDDPCDRHAAIARAGLLAAGSTSRSDPHD